ncbi:hypothetical protein [Streptomyces sp. NL15-2K]|uniref:hypothetical protein n=1 Tax=Streptomyces sp. NL15-2K TaxID=376149 RepID=UPI000FF99D77|nr:MULTISPECIES: hypothetical protein [Actinomycetes]WKX09530.1 hypothetical protein Q4V64_19355 [Kutzneria buriramensis]GCB48957.1 hypothetical protein SNL152K_6287 [Streptomyces sp. NL15-2K]
MEKKPFDIDRLKQIAAEDDELPEVTTMDTQVRTSKFMLFPDPYETDALEEES